MELLSCWSFSCDFFKGLKLPALIYGGPQVPLLPEQIQAQLDAAHFTLKFPSWAESEGDSSGRHKWFAECQFTLWPGAKERALMLISSLKRRLLNVPGSVMSSALDSLCWNKHKKRSILIIEEERQEEKKKDREWLHLIKNRNTLNTFLFLYILIIVIYSCDTPVFSVTWFFRNHCNGLIWCSRNITCYYQTIVLFNFFV